MAIVDPCPCCQCYPCRLASTPQRKSAMETDYREIGMSIADTIGKVTKPLTSDQKLFLVGAISPWLQQRDDRIAELEQQIENLQKALAFWLPHVPAEDTERGKRIGDDTYLLIGYEGEVAAGAEELGWIKLTELMVRGSHD
jgi:hypothetical protein